LLTTGLSWRENKFSDILVWKHFMPHYLLKLNEELLPKFETENYENTLGSMFGQYRHKFDAIELWAGIRNDDHNRFEDKVSYSLGAAWNFSQELILKAIYGTAYRTPFAGQVEDDKDISLEMISSTNVQLAWKPDKGRSLSLTLFKNEIEEHVIEDRYSGKGNSIPNSQTINGVELECDFRITDDFSVSGNITALNNSGPDETYSYAYVSDNILNLNYDYDAGCDTMANFALNWKLTPNIILVPEFHYRSKVQSFYLSDQSAFSALKMLPRESSDVWLMDVHLKLRISFPLLLIFLWKTSGMNNIISQGHTP